MEYIALILLAAIFLSLRSIAGTARRAVYRFENAPIQPGQFVFIRAFGLVQQCRVIATDRQGVLVEPVTPADAT